MNAPFNRCMGFIVLDVTMSNPNGDPDMESDPRTLEADGRGVISPVSFKRKLRDLVERKTPVFEEAKKVLELEGKDDNNYEILERRGRDRDEIKKMGREKFIKTYWDARLFGNTFLESMKESGKGKDEDFEHFISTGVIQVGVGLSVAPVQIERMTTTNKSGVQEGKDRGMAPLGFRVVQHGIYCIPFYVNPSIAAKTGATKKDLKLFTFMLPYVYRHTMSAVRPQVEVLHAWFAEHKSPLGSYPDYKLIEAFTPTIREGVDTPVSAKDYLIPDQVPNELKANFSFLEDLNIAPWK